MSRKHKKRGRAHTLHEPVTDGAYIVYNQEGRERVWQQQSLEHLSLE